MMMSQLWAQLACQEPLLLQSCKENYWPFPQLVFLLLFIYLMPSLTPSHSLISASLSLCCLIHCLCFFLFYLCFYHPFSFPHTYTKWIKPCVNWHSNNNQQYKMTWPLHNQGLFIYRHLCMQLNRIQTGLLPHHKSHQACGHQKLSNCVFHKEFIEIYSDL